MRIGISFDGFSEFGETLAFATAAAQAGCTAFWMADHLGYRDPIVSCLAFLLADPRVTVVPTAVSPYLRHPMPAAMQMATLAEAAPGRVALALGVGNPLFLAESGEAVDKPIRVIRDFVQGLRGLWSGEPVYQDAMRFQLQGARMMFQPPAPIPIYLSPMKPQMLRLAGTLADGLVLSAGLSAGFVRHSLAMAEAGLVAAGRQGAPFRRAGYVSFMASADGRSAVEGVRRKLAFLFRNRFIDDNLAFTGIPIDQEAIIAAMAKRDYDAAARLIPDDAVDAFGVAGTLAQCRAKLAGFAEAGLDEIVLLMAGEAADHHYALPLFAPG